MVRYTNRRDHQTKVMFGNDELAVRIVTSQQFCHAIHRRLCFQRFFTHHAVDRITTRQFLFMLQAA